MNERMTEYVPVKMTPAELAALRSMADERSCSVGAVVRWAVRKAVLADPPGHPPKMNEGSTVFVQSTGATPLVQSHPSA